MTSQAVNHPAVSADKREAHQKGDVRQVFNTYAMLGKPEASFFNRLRMAVRDRTVFGR